MSDTTSIEWCDATWSPWEGCTKVSPGCDHCYAEGMNRWLRKGANWGPGAPRREYGDEHWEKPLRWNKAAAKAGKRLRVFPSVCDPFDNEVDPAWRARFFALIRATPHLDWLLLTKRIGNAARMVEEAVSAQPELLWQWPWFHVWLGATVVNQEEADRDITKLLATPAHVHFISYEPALGPLDATRWLGPQCDRGSVPGPAGVGGVTCPRCDGYGARAPGKGCRGLDWIIAGGESGPGARPAHPDWFRALRDQCAAAGVPFMFKQWGEWAPALADQTPRHSFATDQRVDIGGGRSLPFAVEVARVGKKTAGRLLDGVEHNGFPT